MITTNQSIVLPKRKALFLSIFPMNEEEMVVHRLVQIQYNQHAVARKCEHDFELNTISTTIEEGFPFFRC